MNHLLISQIEKLPLEVQKEVEKYVQNLTDQFVTKEKPVDPEIMAKRRQVFSKLDERVFSESDF